MLKSILRKRANIAILMIGVLFVPVYFLGIFSTAMMYNNHYVRHALQAEALLQINDFDNDVPAVFLQSVHDAEVWHNGAALFFRPVEFVAPQDVRTFANKMIAEVESFFDKSVIDYEILHRHSEITLSSFDFTPSIISISVTGLIIAVQYLYKKRKVA